VLILSTFAGAAHELSDALLINPYDVSQLFRFHPSGAGESEEEQARRMQRMRHTCASITFIAGGDLLSDLTEIRVELTERLEAPQAT